MSLAVHPEWPVQSPLRILISLSLNFVGKGACLIECSSLRETKNSVRWKSLCGWEEEVGRAESCELAKIFEESWFVVICVVILSHR